MAGVTGQGPVVRGTGEDPRLGIRHLPADGDMTRQARTWACGWAWLSAALLQGLIQGPGPWAGGAAPGSE